MAHIEGKPRNQYTMLPPVMDEWIPKGHKVRCKLREKCIRGKEGGVRGKEIWVLKDREFYKRQKEVIEKNKGLMEKRKTIVEGVIGMIKEVLNFRRFLLRGLKKVKGEWRLVLSAYNIIKFYRLINREIIRGFEFKGS
ncbi:MAG: transposase [Thermoanaerobaculia bacterium]